MPVREPVFSLKNTHFRFPDDQENTLKDLTFDILPGERAVISGPSGCGKSTLLYLLNRLYPLNCDGILSGSIRLFDKRAEDYAPGEINHRVATVFQDPDSQFCMPTVEAELAFTLENLHVPFTEMESRITDVLSLTGLTPLRHAVIQSLSGGMKQRVATACALIMKPEVLLLDEPISHLDPLTAKQFIVWLDGLQKQFGLTIVAVEHRLDLWESFFDRDIQLDACGRILADQRFIPKAAVAFPKRPTVLQAALSLEVSGLATSVNGKSLLSPLSFSVHRGEVTVVAGPNGSGKSTLLKTLCGIYKSSGGTVESDGIGYVPQSPEYLFLTQRIKDEIAYSASSTPAEIQDLMERLRLTDIQYAHPFAVSHGQKRRVAIASMLADKRQVLLMDEPTSGQDAAALQALALLIAERANEGISFLIVTHDMEFAAAVADSILLIKNSVLTGKFACEELWADEELLASHHLLAPKGVKLHAESFA
ncbi:ABC transporter ATP-binding protein [Planococcus glaciei]|uniref:ABC transporter ATP-binding protein n=1 Tax=Planococcus glaciei TaxID=459472 RepID=UPI000ADD2F51|nr:ABC transporter ATP-binding protein [Planococcus glaciei]